MGRAGRRVETPAQRHPNVLIAVLSAAGIGVSLM
jgi:hypothetical protein